MAFHVYPDEALNVHDRPLPIAALADSGLKPIGPLPGAGVSFIRIAWQHVGVDPQVSLVADAGAEVPVPIDGMTHPVYTPGGALDAGDAIMEPGVAGVYRLRIFLNAAATWQIRFKNTENVPRAVTWVVADTDAESLQPWLHVLPTGSYNVFAGQADTFALHMTNLGTGPMTVTAEPAPAPNFAVTAVPDAPIPPLGAGDVIVTYTGAAVPGQVTALYTATSATTGDTTALPAATQHNNQVTLTAVTRLIEAVFLVDASGSMATTPEGGDAPFPDQSRWGKLKTGASQAFNLLVGFAEGKGKFGLAAFPDITTGVVPAPVPSSKELASSRDISAMNALSLETALAANTPVKNGGGTPMGHGIARAMGSVAGNYGMFQSAADAVNFNERFIILQSDGANNSPIPPTKPQPTNFYLPEATAGTSFTDKKIKVLAVGYGKPGTPFEVDEALLQALAANSSGYYLPAFADNTGMALRKKLREAIAAGLHLDPTVDPHDFLTAAHPERRYDISVLPFDTKVAFVVDWTTANAPIRVSLVTPLCEVITEQSAPTTAGIFFRTNANYRMFVIAEKYLRNTAAPDKPRHGTWTLIVGTTAVTGAAALSEEFEYDVITESRLRMRVGFDKPKYGTGQKIGVSATLTLDGQPIRNAAVTLQLTAPGQSADNWLARNAVSPQLLARARETLGREEVTAVGVKAFALSLKGVKFTDFTNTRTIQLVDTAGTGVYGASIDATSVPGNYQCYVTAVGIARGVAFRREQRAATLVEVLPSPKFSYLDAVYHRDPEGGTIRAEVRAIPRDQFGNQIMFDPASRARLVLTARGVKMGQVTFNGDGSYTTTLEYPAKTRPSVGVRLDGVDVIKAAPLAPVATLTYVDRVFDAKLGNEAKPGINAHPEPKDALGDVATKKNQFVSLGGLGWIVVGVDGRTIVAQGADDITVFVAPDESLRPYLVEVAPEPRSREWVLLGTSPGVTQSFSLGKCTDARVVRITDKSGRVRDNDQTPLTTPGVSIIGVGVALAK